MIRTILWRPKMMTFFWPTGAPRLSEGSRPTPDIGARGDHSYGQTFPSFGMATSSPAPLVTGRRLTRPFSKYETVELPVIVGGRKPAESMAQEPAGVLGM